MYAYARVRLEWGVNGTFALRSHSGCTKGEIRLVGELPFILYSELLIIMTLCIKHKAS